MAASGTVVAVNRDRGARIFEHADLGVTADAAELIDAVLAVSPG
jgi:electron transfer flavoprotein alpha subunit